MKQYKELLEKIDNLYDMPSDVFENYLNDTLAEVPLSGGVTLQDYVIEWRDE